MSKYPACDKLASVASVSQEIGEFLGWLQNDGLCLAKWDNDEDELFQHYENITALLARYFDIDLVEVERERREILDEIKAQNETGEQNG